MVEILEDEKFRVNTFDDQNYQLWKMQMEDCLYQKDLFLPLDGLKNKPTSMKDEEWEILDRSTMRTIRFSLKASITFNISKEKKMVDLMKALAKLYEKPSTSNKVFLMKHLFNMEKSKGGYVADHLNDFNTVTSQLSYVRVKFDDEVRDILILCSLPKSWNGLVMDVSNSVSKSSSLSLMMSLVLSSVRK